MADWPLTAPDGAYEIGGGDYHFGQDVTEEMVRSLFEVPDFTAANALTVLPQLLLRLPLDALKRFEDFLPGPVAGAFDTVAGAVEAIMGALTDAPRVVPQIIQILNEVLSDLFGGIDFSNPPTSDEFWRSIPIIADLLSGRWLTQWGVPTAGSPNLLADTEFATGSIPPGSEWGDLTGQAHVVANGQPHALRSGRTPTDRIPVATGQTLKASIQVWHAGLVWTNTPVFLMLTPYHGQDRGESVELASYTPTTQTLAEPGFLLAGSWKVPEGVTGVQVRLFVSEAATSGDIYFDFPSLTQSTPIDKDSVAGLAEALQEQLGRWQVLVDTLYNSFTGANEFLVALESLAEAMLNINPENVGGVGGSSTLAGTIFSILNAIVGGLVGTPGEGASQTDVFNIAKIISSRASQGAMAWEVQGYRNNTSPDNGLLPSSEANYNLTVVNATLEATQAASLIGIDRVRRSAPMGVVSWRGYGTAGLTAFYVNIWKINPTTGAWTLVHHSPNILGDLDSGTTPIPWQFYFLDTPLARTQGEDYAYELVPVGGSHHVRGFSTDDNIPDHPYAQVVALAATRNNTSNPNTPPASIAKASVVRSNDIPWIETAIDTGNSSDQRDPVVYYFTDETTIPVPNWAAQVDRVAVGKGGDGADGGSFGFYGRPGTPGKWAADTLVRGVDFSGDTILTIVPANDSHSGSTISIPGNTLTAEDGENGSGVGFGGRPIGKGPAPFEYHDEPYQGGADQEAWGGDGVSSGGAGNGGHWLTGFLTGGGKGAKGGAWVKFWPATSSTPEPPDTTPPTAPTTTLVDRTYSSFTILATGGSD